MIETLLNVILTVAFEATVIRRVVLSPVMIIFALLFTVRIVPLQEQLLLACVPLDHVAVSRLKVPVGSDGGCAIAVKVVAAKNTNIAAIASHRVTLPMGRSLCAHWVVGVKKFVILF